MEHGQRPWGVRSAASTHRSLALYQIIGDAPVPFPGLRVDVSARPRRGGEDFLRAPSDKLDIQPVQDDIHRICRLVAQKQTELDKVMGTVFIEHGDNPLRRASRRASRRATDARPCPRRAPVHFLNGGSQEQMAACGGLPGKHVGTRDEVIREGRESAPVRASRNPTGSKPWSSRDNTNEIVVNGRQLLWLCGSEIGVPQKSFDKIRVMCSKPRSPCVTSLRWYWVVCGGVEGGGAGECHGCGCGRGCPVGHACLKLSSWAYW